MQKWVQLLLEGFGLGDGLYVFLKRVRSGGGKGLGTRCSRGVNGSYYLQWYAACRAGSWSQRQVSPGYSGCRVNWWSAQVSVGWFRGVVNVVPDEL